MRQINDTPLFSLCGTVTHGKQLGRTIGMPTANMKTDSDISGITLGVYAVIVHIQNEAHWGITHIGQRPSVDGSSNITIETYIFNFDEEIYGDEIAIDAYRYLRPTIAFQSLDELRGQVDKDIKQASEYFDQ